MVSELISLLSRGGGRGSETHADVPNLEAKCENPSCCCTMSCHKFQKEEKHFPFGAEGPCASGGRNRGPIHRILKFLAASSPRHRHHLPVTNAAQSPCHPRLFQPSTKSHKNAELYNDLCRRCITQNIQAREEYFHLPDLPSVKYRDIVCSSAPCVALHLFHTVDMCAINNWL